MYLLNHSLCPWVFDFKESKFKMGFWLHKWGQLRKERMWGFLKVVLSKMGKNPERAWCTPQEPIMNHCEFSEDRHICSCPSIQKVCFRRLHLKEVINHQSAPNFSTSVFSGFVIQWKGRGRLYHGIQYQGDKGCSCVLLMTESPFLACMGRSLSWGTFISQVPTSYYQIKWSIPPILVVLWVTQARCPFTKPWLGKKYSKPQGQAASVGGSWGSCC